MLDSAATHFFCVNKAQFETLNVNAAEEEISITNGDIVRSASRGTVRLLVNSKDQGKRISHELLLHEIVYIPALEVNLLSTWMLNEMRLYVIADEKDSKIQLYENHDIIITSFISMNNLYFFNVVENPFMRVNIIIKKSNYRQRQNAVRFIMI